MHVLVITGLTLPDVSEADLARIRDAAGPEGRVTLARSTGEAIEVAQSEGDVEVVMGAITPALFRAAPRLRWVHAIASGVDAYLFPEMRESEVLLTGEKGLVGGHLADHAFALLLALTRGLAEAVRLGPRSWERRMEFRRSNVELSGLTMGIVGLGGTGREVARRAVAFGMRCRAVDLAALPPSEDVPLVETMDAFGALLAASDVVAVCCPLTEATRGLFDAAAFEQMKPTALLLNVTRGGIVDGDALVEALRSGTIAGAGLDVLPEEPLPPEHPLWTLPNAVMTPHTAGASQLRAGRNIERFCENLRRMRAGEALVGLVDKREGF
jgi:phosphoglycerate dehydrogenase-like enzyme